MTPAELEERFLQQQAQLNMLHILVRALVQLQPPPVAHEVRKLLESIAAQTSPEKPVVGTPAQEAVIGYQHEEAMRFLKSLGAVGGKA